jgi:Kef-type K+ transport system membrane component KefB/Trk K+ transport system NAD-binding subunit
MEQIFIQLAIILFTAFVVARIVRAFKQPIIIGYILAGVIIALIVEFGFAHIGATGIIDVFSEFGIAFLLFIVGLHMNPRIIKEVGKASLLIGLAQILITFGVGFLISLKVLGYNLIVSSYIGIALSFSSTIIIMKLLSDKRQLDSLYGKISIGILIVQDLVAIIVLMFISSISTGTDLSTFALNSLLGGAFLMIFLFAIGFLFLPRMIRNIASSQELLFLFSICWCFVIAVLFSLIGFSIEIGALIAGVILSISPYSIEISSKIRPLRDFFLIIFFIILGLNIQINNIGSIIVNSLVISALALILKPLILMVFMAFFGFTKRTNFFVGTTLGQISEFSLIILAVGVAMGHINEEILSTFTLSGIITITLSTYMIIYSEKFYKKMSRIASIFERKKIKEQRGKLKKKYEVILFGYNRIGFSILRSLKKLKKNYLVIDFNPDTISSLQNFRIPCLYGDASDSELLEELPLEKVNLIVSTLPDFETNVLLIETIRFVNKDAIIISSAHQIKEALELYQKGANYVLTPHLLGGEYVARMIGDYKTTNKDYEKEKIKHIKMLQERLERAKIESEKT